MLIDPEQLKAKGAVQRHYQKNDIVFFEHDQPAFYYQIIEGSVKMFNSNVEGKQFIQAVFTSGSSFGEPPLFINEKYPSTAIVTENSLILRMPKEDFLEFMLRQPEFQMKLIQLLSRRLYNKSITAKEIINNNPESRILAFLDAYKKKCDETEKMIIPYTRQTIADFTGLRIETVIRTLSKMKEEHKIDIVNRKVIF